VACRNIKQFVTPVLRNLGQIAVIDHEHDLLTTEFGQLHGLLNQVMLSLTLGVVSADVVFNQCVLLGSTYVLALRLHKIVLWWLRN